MQAIDLAGQLDVFGAANARADGTPPCRLCIIGLDTHPVRAENGLVITPACGLDDAPALDTLLIPGGGGNRAKMPIRYCLRGCANVP